MNRTSSPQLKRHRHFSFFGLLCAGLAMAASGPALAATSLQVGLSAATSINESNRQVILQWNAEPSKTYLVQCATDLSTNTDWVTVEPVKSSTNGPIRWMAPEATKERRFYRLELPQPAAYSAEPIFNDSGNPDARLYITGQCLPTNGTVRINGQSFAIIEADPNGGWVGISLNGLPPGVPWIEVVILDGASNTVATLPIEGPLAYASAMSVEQLEGPPDEPPASPAMKQFKGHVTLLKREFAGGGPDADTDGYSPKGLRVKEKGNRTKCTSSYLMEPMDDGPEPDSRGVSPKALKVKEKGNRTKCTSNFEWDPVDELDPAVGYITPAKLRVKEKGSRTKSMNNSEWDPVDEPEPDSRGVSPKPLKAKEKGNRTKCTSNLHINPPTGELGSEEVDLAIPGRGLDFVWMRTYRSRTGPNSEQGAGWDFSYHVTLSRQQDGTARLCTGNGRCDTFYPDGTNGWFRDEYFVAITDLDLDGVPDLVTFSDTGRWVFRPQVQGDASSGKLAQIIDRNNNSIRCEYDIATGRLLRVVDTLDRTNTIGYSQGFISSVTDFSGRVVRYEYNGNGDLVACVTPPVTGTPNGNDFPGGKTNRYSYSSGFADARLNHNLLTCTDGKGQTWLQVTYQTNQNPTSFDFDAVASVVAGSDRTDLWRGKITPSPSNNYTVSRCIVRDPVGNVAECFFDSRHRCVKVQEFTGRANPSLPTTPTNNRPTGKLRPGDPDYFETQLEWNVDSLCTLVRDPEGTSTEMLYQRSYNQNNARSNHAKAAYHGGDLRLLRLSAVKGVDDDADGITDALVQTFEHDQRFGSGGHGGGGGGGWNIVPVGNGVAIKTKGTGADKNRIAGGGLQVLPVGNGVAINTKGTGADKNRTGAAQTPIVKGSALGGLNVGFVTRSTDSRGTAITCDYDARGNPTRVAWVVDASPPVIDLAYNGHGQVTSVTNAADGNGYRRVDTLDYYTNGPQAGYCRTFTVDAAGPVVTLTAYEYDARGNLTKITDPLGRVAKFHNNQLNQRVRVETPTNLVATCATDFYYDANDNLVQCVSELRDQTDAPAGGHVVLIGHDFMDRVATATVQVSTNEFATNRFVYDGNGRVIQCDSPLAVAGADPDAVMRYDYDERGLLFRCLAAPGTGLGATNEYQYDGNGNLRISKIDALTVKTRAYDGFNRCVSATDAMGNVVTFAYNRNDSVVYERFNGQTNDLPGSAGNRRLSETRYEYDKLERLSRRRMSFFDIFTELGISDGESTQTFTYAPNGACLSSTDDNSHVSRFTYDTLGRLATITDPKTNILAFAFDAAGNILSATQSDRSDLSVGAQQFSVTYTYDSLDRMIRSVDNVGNTNLYAFDSRDNLVRHTDPRGNDTVCVYDGLCRCVTTVCYEGAVASGITINTTHTEYDVNSRCVATTDSNTNKTTYAHDSLGRCVSVSGADKSSCTLVWSPRSNLILYGDARGTLSSNTFDALDRRVRRDIFPSTGVASTTTFETFAYDSCSRCVAASNNTSLATFAFDSLDNCIASTINGLTTTYTFDGVGNGLTMTYPSGRIVTRTYNALDEVATVSSSAGGGLPFVQLASFAYEGPGRLGRILRANNISTRLQWNGLPNPANPAGDFGWGQVRSINHQVANGGTVIDQRIAAYDRSQNKLLRAQTVAFFSGGPRKTNYLGYDALDRLTQFSRVSNSPDDLSRSYLLDGNGNRVMGFSNGVAAAYAMENTLPEPADYQMNQYTLTPFAAPQEYDKNGNMVSRVTATAELEYSYDYADRLVSVTDMSGGLPKPIVACSYDALGRRISKTLYNPAEVITYVYGGDCDDSDDPILETRVNGVAGQSFVLDGSRSTDDGMVLICTFTSGGQPLYYHCDELRNALALTDAAGTVVERYEYDDYGLPQFLTVNGLPINTNASPAGNPFLFHGMEWDSEAELYSIGMGKGMYDWHDTNFDPKIGRAIRGKVKTIRDTGNGFVEGNQNPWSAGTSGSFVLKKEEGGRHTPFQNKMSQIKSKEDVYVWKIKTKEDVYVWKVKSKEDTYTWKVGADRKKKSLFIPAATLSTGVTYGKGHTRTGHVTLMK